MKSEPDLDASARYAESVKGPTRRDKGNVTRIVTFPEELAVNGLGDLMIIDGGIAAPSGWEKHDVDLNEGSGGAFLYVAIQRSTADNLIVDVAITNTGGSDSRPAAPSGYTLVRDQNGIVCDLNRGAGGDFIWMSYRKGTTENYVGNFHYYVRNFSGLPSVPDGEVLIPEDLNDGAEGLFIYIAKKMRLRG